MRPFLRSSSLLSKLAPSLSPAAYFRSPLARTMATATTPSPVLKKPVKLACIQLASGADKAANLSHARDKCFNSPYGCDYFPAYAETLLPSPPPRDQSPLLPRPVRHGGRGEGLPHRRLDPRGGPFGPELGRPGGRGEQREKKKYYNTSLTFGPDGGLLASHRKVHLFDIDIPGKITFRESDVLSPGNKVTLVDLPDYGRIAVAICYDIRFPELATVAARKGCFALVYPGAFNTTTGPLHWRLQGQARAMDNQIYVAMCSPARDETAAYHAWGHSLIVDPMAQVLVEADEAETTVCWELDSAKIEETRKNIPLVGQRRFDVYPDISEGKVRFEE
ncbi:Hydrolase [Apiospora hydei]|uniref:Hydrolase n=1 Tax=Apiospora hydei TaxID=1337664 RepID=A0ABR1X3I2_9PEZI